MSMSGTLPPILPGPPAAFRLPHANPAAWSLLMGRGFRLSQDRMAALPWAFSLPSPCSSVKEPSSLFPIQCYFLVFQGVPCSERL